MRKHLWQGLKISLVLAFIVFVIWTVKMDCQNQAYGQFQSPLTGLSNQSVKGDHVDSTSEDFVFQDGFRGTSVTDDSMFMTKKYIDDAAGGLVNQSVKGNHVDSTSEDFVFNDAYRITSAQAESIFVTKNFVEKIVEDSLDEYLLLAGGTMSGGIDMGDQDITNVERLDCDTISINFHLIADFAGDGLTVSSNELVADLGTSIVTGEIVDQTIVKADIDTTSGFVFGSAYLITSAVAGSAFVTKDYIDGVAGWTDDGTVVRLTASTDSVGIGTTTPDEILHLFANNAALKLEDNSGNDATINVGNSQLCLAIDPDDLVESSDICFDIDGDEVARFHQSTNFGIGTLSPSERLSVEGNAIITGRITSGDTLTRSFVIASPDATFDFPFWQTKRAITITAVSAVCTGGTNVIGALQEYNATGTAVDAAVDGDWTITTSEYTDASFTNAGIDAGDWLGWKTTSVSGSVTFFSITFEYTEQ